MKHQHKNFGPWTTSLDSGSRMQLSTFWRQRMRRLPGLVSTGRTPRQTLGVAIVLAVAVGLLPLVELVPAAQVDGVAKGNVTSETQEALQRRTRQKDMINQLAELHGYKLEPGQLLKHIGEPFPELREELRHLLSNSVNPGDEMKSEAILFLSAPEEETRVAMFRVKIATLEDVLKNVLHLERQQFECHESVLDSAFPGDWVMSWDAWDFRLPTVEEVASLEEIFNEELPSKLTLEWKQVEKTALIVKGDYEFSPLPRKEGKPVVVEGEEEGFFLFPVLRRGSLHTFSSGSFQRLLQAIGEVVRLPVVNEINKLPNTPRFLWKYEGKIVSEHAPLDPDLEKTFLDSLSKQTGFQFVKEKRLVHKLFIKAEPTIELREKSN
ncbi:MAG: hypothetical protein GXP24_02220 [Planctomycetes bacterium]|nr:hypothetical protein [Planctomycetota bacterium]